MAARQPIGPFSSVDVDPTLYREAMEQHAADVAAQAADAPRSAAPDRLPPAGLAASSDAEAFIRNWEGSKARAYGDVALNPTIGVGHLMTPADRRREPMTPEAINDLYQADLRKHEQIVRDAVKVPLTQGEFDALVSLAFNLPAALGPKSTLLRLLNAGDYGGAAEQFPVWRKAHVGGKPGLSVVPGLENRRRAEAEVFRGGAYRGP